VQAGRDAPTARPRAPAKERKLEPVARHEHGFTGRPARTGREMGELVDDRGLAGVLAAHQDD